MSEQPGLAAPVDRAAADETYILFVVAGTTYGVPSRYVLHMEMIEHVTAVPNAPAFVEGVVFSRGQVVPVVNLRARFGFERAATDLRTRLIVVQVEQRRIGLLADEAREFLAIPGASIHPPNDTIRGLSANYLEGVATVGERLVLILNIRDVVATIPTAA
jgi:chemotaxis signal transduction protein